MMDKSPSAESFLLQAIPMDTLKIPRGESSQVTIRSEEGSAVVWQFCVVALDVAFRVTVNDIEVETWTKRYDSTHGIVEGTLDNLTASSQIVLHWDNSYSLLRTKEVGYRVMNVPLATLHAAREAANEYQIQYNHPLHTRARAASAASRSHIRPTATISYSTLIQSLEVAVVDTVAVFMTQPDVPLHAGSARSLVLALEAILHHGVQARYNMDVDESYFHFLVETRNVLRDDKQVVDDAELFTPPNYMRYLGWGRARAFLFLALNRNVLHRALDNLIKRRSLIQRYYHSDALLAQYDLAKKAISQLTALYGVKFQLVPLQDDFGLTVDTFPPNLYQMAAMDAFVTNQIQFDKGEIAFFVGSAALDDFTTIQDCTPTRYLCLSTPVEAINVPRGDVIRIPLGMDNDAKTVAVVQFQVPVHRVNVLLADENSLTTPWTVQGADAWVECVVRIESPMPNLHLVFDNTHSMLRAKSVQYRLFVTSAERYSSAWTACKDVANVICWKQVLQQSLDSSTAQAEALQAEELRLLAPPVPPKPDDGLTATIADSMSNWLGAVWSDASSCAQCGDPLTLFRRRQECSLCYKAFCLSCSRHTWASKPVCDRCYLTSLDKKKAQVDQEASGGKNPVLEALRVNPTYDKYFKMLSFGVPPSAVGQKMQQDYIPQDVVDLFVRSLEGPSTSVEPSTRSKATTRPQLLRRQSTLRKVHWTTLDTSKVDVAATIWTRQTDKRKHAPISLSGQDMDRVIAYFGEQVGRAAVKKAGTKTHSALDARRSNNINIGLNRFKAIGGATAVLTALNRCDLSVLPVEILQTLQEIGPTPAELKRYSNFRGSVSVLDSAERFLVDMAKIYRVQEKIHVLLFVVQYPTAIHELNERLRVISLACHQVLSSERLPRYFEIILALGNVLNEGTSQADASGVTLASLLKLSETRSTDQSMTLLQFLLLLIHERGEIDLFHVVDELDVLGDAKRYSNVLCSSQFAHLQKQTNHLMHELQEEETNDRVLFEKAQAAEARKQRMGLQTAALSLPGNVPLNGESQGRQALLAAIRRKNESETTDDDGATSSKRSALLSAIRKRAEPASDAKENADAATAPSRHMDRSALFASIRAIQAPSKEKSGGNEEPAEASSSRHALLASIRSPPRDAQPRNYSAALMAAIRQRPATTESSNDGENAARAAKPSQERAAIYSKANNPFLTVMEAHATKIQREMALLHEKMLSMGDHWHDVAVYLGESPASSEYALGLLHRFLLDVQVAYRLLVSKGLIQPLIAASPLHVGDRVATVYGAATVLALRRDKLDVVFPWAAQAFLTPASILRPGDRVLCRRWGRAIVTDTRYADGLIEVRFGFGYGVVQVDSIVSIDPKFDAVDHLQHHDPVMTPFGPGRLVQVACRGARRCAIVRLTQIGGALAFFQPDVVHFAYNEELRRRQQFGEKHS
ncbi:Delphilin [Aphanomyces cochlioides]|nr:Delphilin [Aphanomyces cochlioides]